MKKKDVTGPAGGLEFDPAAAARLLKFLKIQDEKMQGLLIWCSISSLLVFLAVMFTVLRFYALLKTTNSWLLAAVFLVIYVLFGAFVWVQWRTGIYKPLHSAVRSREFCHFQLQYTRKQLRLLTGCLITYSLIVLAACLLCWLEIRNGAIAILKVTAPISILVYLAGLYLLIRLSRKADGLNTAIRAIEQRIIQQFNRQ